MSEGERKCFSDGSEVREEEEGVVCECVLAYSALRQHVSQAVRHIGPASRRRRCDSFLASE